MICDKHGVAKQALCRAGCYCKQKATTKQQQNESPTSLPSLTLSSITLNHNAVDLWEDNMQNKYLTSFPSLPSLSSSPPSLSSFPLSLPPLPCHTIIVLWIDYLFIHPVLITSGAGCHGNSHTGRGPATPGWPFPTTPYTHQHSTIRLRSHIQLSTSKCHTDDNRLTCF